MSRRGVSDRVPKAQIRKIDAKVKEPKVGSMVNITMRVIMSEMETKTVTKTSIGVTMRIEMIRMVPMFLIKIEKVLLGFMEVVWRELRICCTK